MTDHPRLKNNSLNFKRWLQTLSFFIVAVSIAMPRLLDLGRYVTTDEPLWLYRSANFLTALKTGNWEQTYQSPHPGVTTMWAGVAGLVVSYPGFLHTATNSMNYSQYERFMLDTARVTPLKVLIASRMFIVLLTTFTLTIAFWFAARLFGWMPAFIAFLLIAFDPFCLALTRVLHLDGLLSGFLLLSLLSYICFWREKSYLALFISGAGAGLAWLTKSPGLFIFPFIGLLTVIFFLDEQRRHPSHQVKKVILKTTQIYFLWVFSAALISFLVWPALTVNPRYVLRRVLFTSVEMAQAGHEHALYYKGQIFPTGQIGLDHFDYYGVNFLWRTTPIVLIGLALLVGFWVYKTYFLRQGGTDVVTISLSLFFFGFLILMSFGDKKFDRYILPVFLVADILSAVGYGVWVEFWRTKTAYVNLRFLPLVFMAIALLFQFTDVLRIVPYYHAYYNPLMGGPKRAPQWMQIGWGEGLDLAAEYLNQKPDAQRLVVYSWYGGGGFSYYFHGKTRYIPAVRQTKKMNENLRKANYIVLYVNQIQRNLGQFTLEYVENKTPEAKIYINGIEYVRIYAVR
jgi:4-amino-4-deoxy-L-arabinose transferase-like glycosyltransferase